MKALEDRIEEVFGRIESAAARAGQSPDGVRLLAASKSRTPEEIAVAARAGVRLFGENRVQEAREKIPLCPGSAEWHFIGHLQSNKAGAAAALFTTVHSVDSARLAAALDVQAARLDRRLDVLVEVNVSGERSKFGVAPEALEALLAEVAGLDRLRVTGLMAMAPFVEEPERARPYFARARELRDGAAAALGVALPELSMGMSHDFEAAIAEGATIVRIGTLLFGERRSARMLGAD